jgi:hypothetical protein
MPPMRAIERRVGRRPDAVHSGKENSKIDAAGDSLKRKMHGPGRHGQNGFTTTRMTMKIISTVGISFTKR